ncbi:DUF4153 domain-containing protein [Clostridium sp. SYSU_GA19001]|uniref:DUF4153 domain-containing protein n=1 Tax=Clostridium caldaquaticum TaxID=2940653 RepID=UPI002076E1EF|nr:DUF4153 domain-containing protein [Clostridium caldaquaticum]MCM8710303.1 DUF4153 domain-containing protein [Clostridium caldaquaticum]
MKLLINIKSMFMALYLSVKRFPFTIIFSACVAAVLIIISENPTDKDNLGKIAMVLALGIPVSLCIRLLFERLNKEKTYTLIISYAGSLLLLFTYYSLLLKDLRMVSISRYVAVSLALYLTFIFIPYFPKKDQFEMYVVKIAGNFSITVIYSVVLFAGLSAILFTIDKLLGIRIDEKVYYYTWLIVVFIFAVTHFLAKIPLKNESLASKMYPKPLKVLLLYIVMPLITVYNSILYIYFAKIIITRQWPVGLVANLVLWYSVVTVIVLFLISPIKEEKKWSQIFVIYFPKVILPVLAMMFVSIFIRINAYGITENRYYVIVLAVWVTFVMIYYSIRKKVVNIIIPLILTVLAIVSVFGPFSSFSVSKFSQNKRLKNLLLKNNMLSDSKILASSNVSKEDRIQISSIIDYFNRNHSLTEVKNLPADFKIENMDKVFGFSFENQYVLEGSYFNFVLNNSEGPLDIKGYDYIFDARTLNSKSGNLHAFYDYDSAVVKISYEGKEVYLKDLNTFTDELIKKHVTNSSEKLLPVKEMTFTDENEKIAVKFIFLNISGNLKEARQAKGFEFYMAVKIK